DELLGLVDRRDEEIGAASAERSRSALRTYVDAMSAAFDNTAAQLLGADRRQRLARSLPGDPRERRPTLSWRNASPATSTGPRDGARASSSRTSCSAAPHTNS